MTDDQCRAKTPAMIYDDAYKQARDRIRLIEDDEFVHSMAKGFKLCDLSDPYFLALHDAWGEEWERRQRNKIDAPRVDRVAAALREIRDGSSIGYFGQAQHVLDILKDELLPDPWAPPNNFGEEPA